MKIIFHVGAEKKHCHEASKRKKNTITHERCLSVYFFCLFFEQAGI
jgi:hypothetical protein